MRLTSITIGPTLHLDHQGSKTSCRNAEGYVTEVLTVRYGFIGVGICPGLDSHTWSIYGERVPHDCGVSG